jgi:hypothetical protein
LVVRLVPDRCHASRASFLGAATTTTAAAVTAAIHHNTTTTGGHRSGSGSGRRGIGVVVDPHFEEALLL